MLIDQKAVLFGSLLLFPIILYRIYRARQSNSRLGLRSLSSDDLQPLSLLILSPLGTSGRKRNSQKPSVLS